MTRLYLRRVMSNPNRGDTTQLTAEDNKRTIISLQGGKTVGRAESSDVALFADHGDVGATSTNISRHHARFIHVQAGDIETYHVVDISENGTYINDFRLVEGKTQIKRGDTIKFGHKNGSQIIAGQYAPQPNAEFAFSVEMSNDEETFRLLEETKNTRIKFFSNHPLSRDIGVRVQQEEADSTNGNSELDTMNNSSARLLGSASSNTNQQPYPGANQYMRMDERRRAPHTRNFTEIPFKAVITFLYRTLNDDTFNRKFHGLCQRLKAACTAFNLGSVYVILATFVLEERPHSFNRQEIVEQIGRVCSILQTLDPSCATSHENRNQLADCLLDERGLIQELEEYMIIVNEQERYGNADSNSIGFGSVAASSAAAPVNNFQLSDSSAFHPPASTSRHNEPSSSLIAPIPVRPEIQTPQWVDLLRSINVAVSPETCYLANRNSLQANAMAFLPMIANLPFYNPANTSYIDPLSSMLALQSYRNVRPANVQEVPVIAARENAFGVQGRNVPEPSAPMAPAESSSEVDEERHSSSYSSATQSRRRTESEDSEILDVVGIPEPAPDRQSSRVAPQVPVERLSVVAPVVLVNELQSGGTQTPSPVLHEGADALMVVEEETRKKIEAASDILRKSPTPRVEEQPGPSSSPIIPSTVNSPLPTPTPPVVPEKAVVESDVLRKRDNAEESENPKVDTAENQRKTPEVQKETKSEVRTEVIEPKSKPVVDQPAQKLSFGEQQEQKTTAKPMPDSTASKKIEVVDRRLRMKQLDDVTGDSDSDEEDNARKKKVVRRSARTAKATPAKKTPKVDAEVGEKDDDVDEETDASASEQKERRPRASKSLKRSASKADVRSRATKSPAPADEADEDGEPSKKRRGRGKKAVEEKEEAEKPEEEDEEDDDDEEKEDDDDLPSITGTTESTKVNRKDRCGLKKKYCLCSKHETRINLQWVQCQECSQWFHTYCLRLTNRCFGKEEQFICCGKNATTEAADAKSGRVFSEWNNNGRPTVKSSVIKKRK